MEGFEVADFRLLASVPPQPGGSPQDSTPSKGSPTAGAPSETTGLTASSSGKTVTNAALVAGPGTSGTSATISHTLTIPIQSTGAAPNIPVSTSVPVNIDPKTKAKLGTDKKSADVNPDHRSPPQAT
jgi:hypothetical protein